MQHGQVNGALHVELELPPLQQILKDSRQSQVFPLPATPLD